jgi:hypothetical protein
METVLNICQIDFDQKSQVCIYHPQKLILFDFLDCMLFGLMMSNSTKVIYFQDPSPTAIMEFKDIFIHFVSVCLQNGVRMIYISYENCLDNINILHLEELLNIKFRIPTEYDYNFIPPDDKVCALFTI